MIKLGNHQIREIPRNPTHFANPGVKREELIKLGNHQFEEIPRSPTFIHNPGVDEEELIKLGNHQFKEIPRSPTHFANSGVNEENCSQNTLCSHIFVCIVYLCERYVTNSKQQAACYRLVKAYMRHNVMMDESGKGCCYEF